MNPSLETSPTFQSQPHHPFLTVLTKTPAGFAHYLLPLSVQTIIFLAMETHLQLVLPLMSWKTNRTPQKIHRHIRIDRRSAYIAGVSSLHLPNSPTNVNNEVIPKIVMETKTTKLTYSKFFRLNASGGITERGSLPSSVGSPGSIHRKQFSTMCKENMSLKLRQNLWIK